MKLRKIVQYANHLMSQDATYKLEIHEEELVMAVLLALVLVEKISAGYAHERGPIHAEKKKLKTQVL